MKNLYSQSVKQKYNTLYHRVSKAIQTGKFSTYTAAKKQSVYNRLKRYERRLKHWGIVIASSTALFLSPIAATAQTPAAGSEFKVSTYTTSSQTSPSMGMDSDGDFVIVWQSNVQDGSGNGIYAQRYNNAGVAQGTEFQVNTTTANNEYNPSIGMDSDGDFVIAWQSYGQDGSSFGVYAQRYNNAGVAQGSEFLVNTTTASYQLNPSIGMDSDGDFVIVWQSYGQDGGGFGIYAQRYNNTGVTQGTEFQVNTHTASNQQNPSIGMDSDGDFVIAWESNGQDGSYNGVYAQRYNNAGVAQGSEFQVNTYTTHYQSNPSIGMDSDGDFVIAWQSYLQDGNAYGVYAQRYNNAGVAQGIEFQVNTETFAVQQNPSIGMDSDGDFVIAWHSSGEQDGSYFGVYAQQYNNAGVVQGSEFQVNTYTTNIQANPSIGMESDGDFAIAWQSYQQDGSDDGVYAQRYEAVLPVPTAAGTYNATTATTDDDGYTHYTDANDNLLLSLKTPAGVTIPASAVTIKIGATPATFYNRFCGGSRLGGCFIQKSGGGALINRFWEIDESQVTGGAISSVTSLDLVFYFTQADFDALNLELTTNGQPALGSLTDLQAYVVKGGAALADFPSPTDIGNYRKVYKISNAASSSSSRWKLGNQAADVYSLEFKVLSIVNGGGLGKTF